MIHIWIFKDKKARAMRIGADGHATSPENGYDVCAVTSSLLYGLVVSIKDMGKDVEGRINLGSERGFCNCDVKFRSSDAFRRAEHILKPVQAALEKIEQKHPDDIEIKRL